MGLDVYLYHYKRPIDVVVAEQAAHEEASEKASDEAVKAAGAESYSIMTDEQETAYRARMDAWHEEHPDPERDAEKIEIDSSVYPKHYCKVGYLRSSYNSGGTNHVLREAIGKDLYYVFFGAEDGRREYVVKPDWRACLRRAIEVRDDYARQVAKDGPYAVSMREESLFQAERVSSEREAMAIFQEERRQSEAHSSRNTEFANYSNRKGTFYMGEKGLEVVAVIMGKTTSFLGGEKAATYLVYRLDDSKNDPAVSPAGPFGWYRAATEIVVEMCEWVLSKPDPELYALHWSG